MAEPSRFTEIFLNPGEVYFGGRETRIRTILGSCVSLVIWHPDLLVGGMCHFMLPERAIQNRGMLDGRYANEAVELLCEDVRKIGAPPHEYRLKLFGGGNMFPNIARKGGTHIGEKNVIAARAHIARRGFRMVSEHVEGYGHRHLIFDVWNGTVSLRHSALGVQAKKAHESAALILPMGFGDIKELGEPPLPDGMEVSIK